MIGFNALGRMGRLCNQMFQYASLKGLARKIGADIIIPNYETAVDDGIGNMLRTELFDSFDINVQTGLLLLYRRGSFILMKNFLIIVLIM